MDYHSDRFQDFSLLVFKNNKLVALLPANIVDKVVYSHQGLTYGGMIYSKILKTPDAIYSFKAILQFLNENILYLFCHDQKLILHQYKYI